MSSSIYDGLIRFDTSRFGNERPVDTRHAQNLINNALHLADQAGQVRVAWACRGGDYATLDVSSFSANVWYRIVALGPFPIMLREDGSAYPWRVRLAGYSSVNLDTSTFRAVLGAPSTLAGTARDGTVAANVLEVSTTSSTDAWLTPATDNVITLDASGVTAATESISTVTAAGGSTAVTVQAATVHLEVWAKTSTINSEPRVTAIYGAEYYTP